MWQLTTETKILLKIGNYIQKFVWKHVVIEQRSRYFKKSTINVCEFVSFVKQILTCICWEYAKSWQKWDKKRQVKKNHRSFLKTVIFNVIRHIRWRPNVFYIFTYTSWESQFNFWSVIIRNRTEKRITNEGETEEFT